MYCNCQHFAREILEELTLQGDFSKYSNWVGHFFNYISKKKGEIFPIIVDESGKTILGPWKTHKELDEDHDSIIQTYPDAESLLKAFHRGFQMQSVRFEELKKDIEILRELNELSEEELKKIKNLKGEEISKLDGNERREKAQQKAMLMKHKEGEVKPFVENLVADTEKQYKEAESERKKCQTFNCPFHAPTLLVDNKGNKTNDKSNSGKSGLLDSVFSGRSGSSATGASAANSNN